MKPSASLVGARRRVHRLLRPMAKSVERVAVERLGVAPARLERVRAAALSPAGPPLVRIETVTPAPGDNALLRAAQLDYPHPGARESIHALRLTGAVLGRSSPAVAVAAVHDGHVVAKAAVQRARPDIAKLHPDAPEAARSGFRLFVGTVGLPPTFRIELRAILEDQTRVPLATVQGEREMVSTGYAPTLRPLLVTTLGRSGGSWLMRLLSEHPRIVVHREYPYELRIGRYWLHMFKVLSAPADHLRSAQPKDFLQQRAWVGHNPFYPDALAGSPDLTGWLGRDYAERLGAFCQASIDRFYQQVALSQGTTDALYFAEKYQEDHTPALAWEIFPQAREVFLVRDFRDIATSKLAFGEKQGGRRNDRADEPDGDGAKPGLDARRVRHLLASWRSRSAQAHLVRYEDLVRRPDDTLRDLFAYLDLDHSPETVAGIIRRASKETDDLRRHRTSEDPEASIGRWRRDLDAARQAAYDEAFGDALAAFGYER